MKKILFLNNKKVVEKISWKNKFINKNKYTLGYNNTTF